MSNLSRFESSEGIELVINTTTGEAFATQAGYVRMSGVDKGNFSRKINEAKGVVENGIVSAEILTPGGLQGVVLIPAKLVFKWLMKDNPELAYAMGEAGATIFIHRLADFTLETKQPTRQLTAIDRADKVNALAASLHFFDYEIKNPRFKQGIHDLVGDMLGLTQPTLLSAENSNIWMGVAERAEELGYSVSLVSKHRSQLGKFVKKVELESRKEKRLCNGTQREINLYLVNGDLDETIKVFMDSKVE